jgi:homoserine kinase
LSTNDDQDDTNEIIAATRAAKEQREAAATSTDTAKEKRWPIATIGLGVGSAAVVAALLYANRFRKK